ncbi:MAG: hypothetical protein HW387_718 [Parachlamydiales bacterium]|nr:hypothetical protein [Parachlamydiales bacterium]
MKLNFLENAGCEYFYFKDVFDVVNKEFGDDYNVVVGKITYNSESQIEQLLKAIKCVIPNKKNVFLIHDDENEAPTPCKSLNGFDLIFRTFNNNWKFDNQRTFPLPLGYVTNSDYPYKVVLNKFKLRPLKERKCDIFFSGQTNLERESCVKEAKKLNANSLLQLTPGFFQGHELNEYFDLMNNSKIALVPRGSLFTESYRYFDAYHANCIVITTMPLDKTHSNVWYYHNSPAVRIGDWSQLNQKLIDSLLNDLDKYELLNKEYYDRCISPEGVAKYMIEVMKNRFEV